MGFFSDLGGTLFGGGGDEAANAMGNLAGQVARGGRGLMTTYNDFYRGSLERLPGQAEIPLATYTNEAALDVAQNFDRSRGIAVRNMARMGINPNSGRAQAMEEQLARAEAAARAGAMTTARNAGRQANFGRMATAGQIGLGLAGQGIGALNSAAGVWNDQGAMAMASQDQKYGRLNDMMEAGTLGMWQGGQSIGMNQSQGGGGGGGGGMAAMMSMFGI